MKKTLFISLFLLIYSSCFAQKIIRHSFEEVDQLMVTSPKPILVFLHTDWCKYCKIMERTTFENSKIIERLNTDFYLIYFNPEEKKEITFHKHTFKYIPNGKDSGMNELVNEIGRINGTITFPSICILDKAYNIIFQHASLLDDTQLLTILNQIN